VELIYKNRILVEQFFTAPHDTVIGLAFRTQQSAIDPVFDQGRQGLARAVQNQDIASQFCAGIEMFAHQFINLPENIKSSFTPIQMIQPMLEISNGADLEVLKKMSQIQNFDAWGSSRNFNLSFENY